MKSFRNFLARNKMYAAVTVAGLTLSMAFLLILGVYVQRQLSTDAFQKNADRIFVVANENSVNMGYWMDKHLKQHFPEIEKGCCVASLSSSAAMKIDGEIVYGKVTAADSSFFDMFSYRLVAGDRDDWKVSWDRCMVSREFANAHFGAEDPLGKTVVYQNGDGLPLTVCGVYDDFGNSILETPDVLVRGEVMPEINQSHNERMSNAAGGVCFVMTWPDADLDSRRGDILEWCRENFWIYKSIWHEVRLIPLRDVYFMESSRNDGSGTVQFGNRRFVELLTAMCLLLLAFAVLNYINMTTALTGFRAKEMAVRRLAGAGRNSIFFKIIAESTVVCAVSMLLAVLLAEAIAPAASRMLEYNISVFSAINVPNVLSALLFTFVLGFMSGFVPALLIQKVRPIEIVRGTMRLRTKTVYSKVIIFLQNVVAVVMLVAALAIFLQIRYMINADLGYETEDIMVVDNMFGTVSDLRPLKDRLAGEPQVKAVGYGYGIPLRGTNNNTVEMSDGNWVSFQQIKGDDGYFDILGLREKQDNNCPDSWWLNEYAFKQIGIEESELTFSGMRNGTYQIGGIYHDFKIRPLEEEQSAAMIYNFKELGADDYPWVILVKTEGDDAGVRSCVEKAFADIFPGRMFSADYIADMIKDGFASESLLLRIVIVFTVLSVLVSALGLFAMSSYYMQNETRSMAVKKVFGASYSGVLSELVMHFLKIAGVAFVAAVPVSWFVMDRWLSGYSHRIALHWWIFVAAGMAVALIAVVSVLYQSITAARVNPAESLKKD